MTPRRPRLKPSGRSQLGSRARWSIASAAPHPRWLAARGRHAEPLAAASSARYLMHRRLERRHRLGLACREVDPERMKVVHQRLEILVEQRDPVPIEAPPHRVLELSAPLGVDVGGRRGRELVLRRRRFDPAHLGTDAMVVGRLLEREGDLQHGSTGRYGALVA
jgi:hypothetical protein